MATTTATSSPAPGPPATSPDDPYSESQQAQNAGKAASSQAPAQAHTRTYQACLPCRNRKVRCDLGPVDNPHDPPCQRCRREQKECIFSATRRKRNPADGEELKVEEDIGYEVRNARKRTRTGSLERPLPEGTSFKPLTPRSSFVQPKQVVRASSQQPHSSDEEERVVNNDTQAMLQQTELLSGRDALNLLFEAADVRGDIARHRSQSNSTSSRPIISGDGAAITSPPAAGFAPKPMARTTSNVFSSRGETATPAGAEQNNSVFLASTVEETRSEGFQDAIKAWSGLRFVKAGLFTATEGIHLVDYFYRFLSPLTPVTVPDFQNPMKHRQLLTDEPMLAMTILTVSSRYFLPPGPGSFSRGIAIHERLWNYLQGMIDRMIWGQEQFGGGFCGAGVRSSTSYAADGVISKGLRSPGTVESLLLLTEWHTRALHFPPGDDTDELIPLDPKHAQDQDDSAPSERKMDSWLEPINRSERMSWSLLSIALAIAYELGVYDSHDQPGETEREPLTRTERSIKRRYKNLRDLLFVYVTQISGRINLPSMLPDDNRGNYKPDPAIVELIHSKQQQELVNKSSNRTELVQDVVLYFWCRIAQMIKEGNRDLFPNRAHTRQLISSGQYTKLIEQYTGYLKEFQRDFEACTIIPSHMRHVISIEYEYIRVYVNSIALHAVVERCTNKTPTRSHAQLVKSINSVTPTTASKLTRDTIPPVTLVKWLKDDRHYIREIVHASHSFLRSIVEGLLPEDYLKHSPVRTYFRIISVSMILLKTFALGVQEDDAAMSLTLFDQAAEGLRTCIVDDVHVGSRIAELLEILTHRMRGRLVRVAANGPKSGSRSHVASRAGSKSPAPETNGVSKHRNHKVKTPKPSAAVPANGLAAALSDARTTPGPPQFNPSQQKWASNKNNNAPNPNKNPNTAPVPSNGYGYPQQQQQMFNTSPFMTRANLPNANPPTPIDPLYGISTYDYDPENPAFSIIPPPSYNNNGSIVDFNSPTFTARGSQPATPVSRGFTPANGHPTAFASPAGPTAMSAGNGQFNNNQQQNLDWLALPLDPILNSYGADVTHGGYGPELGGTDMLDLLLADGFSYAPTQNPQQ